MKINEIIERLSKDPFNPELNFEAALEYERTGQSASAVSFYLRAAEYGYDTHQTIAYTSLLKVANCFENQNDRKHTVSNCILQAIAYLPERQEGYFLLSRFHERNGDWQECYTFAQVGLSKRASIPAHLPADVQYPGRFGLLYEKAISGWWLGRAKESEDLFKDLLCQVISDEYRLSIEDNLRRIGAPI
jgi:tetratricopeptide (TPR) repeat protein